MKRVFVFLLGVFSASTSSFATHWKGFVSVPGGWSLTHNPDRDTPIVSIQMYETRFVVRFRNCELLDDLARRTQAYPSIHLSRNSACNEATLITSDDAGLTGVGIVLGNIGLKGLPDPRNLQRYFPPEENDALMRFTSMFPNPPLEEAIALLDHLPELAGKHGVRVVP